MTCPCIKKIAWVVLLSGTIFLLPLLCNAEIYKYKENGVWVYTDTPNENMPAAHEKLVDNKPSSRSESTLRRKLLAEFPAANAIEKAAAATVAIESPIGSGSGFFISSMGHILTNKHVIRATRKQMKQMAGQFSQREKQIATLSDRLSMEKIRIQDYKTRIDQLRAVAAKETNKARKAVYQKSYETERANHQQWLNDYRQRKKMFETNKRQFETQRSDFEYARSVTNLSQSFTIILADETKFYARVIAISVAHDLALLKIDGYQTPALLPATSNMVTQGDPVYAIGNPVRLKNSVTAGIFSGREGGFIKTNAQIYPGNSGGPLILESGHVIGMNTFKQLTHKFEGLGFAIPIQQALEAFGAHLP